MIELLLVPERAALLADHDNKLDVLLLARAPAAPAAGSGRTHVPKNLAIVIDRSGSMRGRPITEARRCAAMIIDRLSAADSASLVVYDNNVEILVPARPVTDPGIFHRALAEVDSRGTTNLHAGWLTGAEQAALGQKPEVLSRVLLLSDGCANQGIADTPSIARHCAEMAAAGVTTSTYGLGEDFNEELMTAMARSGQGNAYYGQTADDLADPFREELDLMHALCGQRLRLSLAPAAGVHVEAVNQYSVDADGRLLLPDVAYGAEAWALLRLTVPRGVLEQGGGGDIHLLTAGLTYTGPEGEIRHAEPVHLRLPRLPAAAFSAVARDERVYMRAQELRAAQLLEAGRAAALAGDWKRVQERLSQLRALAEDNPWLKAGAEKLEEYARRQERQRFSKEAHYTSYKMERRLSGSDESSWSEAEESTKASYLRRKREQGKELDQGPGTSGPKRSQEGPQGSS